MALGNKTLGDLLGPLSEQLGHDGIAEDVKAPAWEFKARRLTDGLSHDELVEMFASEAAKIRVQVNRTGKAELAACIASIIDGGEAGSVVCADDDRFADAGLYNRIGAAVWNEKRGEECIEAARAATYGITYASAGIAETGTVVQPTSARCGRAISLLPLVHIAVVDASTIVATMRDALAAYEGRTLPSQVCFISGPSATADIELVRVEGVHGPMYIHYVIVE